MRELFRVVKKFSTVLSLKQKRKIAVLLLLMVVAGFMETLSVSLVLPFMKLATSPDLLMNNKVVLSICSTWGIESASELLTITALSIAFIFLIKNVYLTWENNVQYRFVYENMHEMQKKLLNNILHRHYSFFLGANSGEIMRIVGSDTTMSFSLLSSILSLISELVISIMLAITVFIISPAITLIALVAICVVMIIILLIVKPLLRKAGEENQKAVAGMNTWIMQSVHGIKELKVTASEPFFLNKFSTYGSKYISTLRQQQILSIIPRYLIEAVCLSSMFMAMAIMIYNNGDMNSLIPTISAIAMAAIRILPSMNRISTTIGTISFGEPMLDKMIENLRNAIESEATLESESELNNRAFQFNEAIELSNVTFSYDNSEENVLENADLIIHKGESIGIIGQSGAGKTTVVDIILGLLYPQAGEVKIDGSNVFDNLKYWRSNIGYIPQSIFLLDDTIVANVIFNQEEKNYSEDKIWEALEDASLKDFVQSLPEGIYTVVGERGARLSGGQKQRLGIARALYREHQILIFDEATSALDNDTENSIMEAIDKMKGNKTMIIIAHRLSTLKKCDRIYKVANKKIFEVQI